MFFSPLMMPYFRKFCSGFAIGNRHDWEIWGFLLSANTSLYLVCRNSYLRLQRMLNCTIDTWYRNFLWERCFTSSNWRIHANILPKSVCKKVRTTKVHEDIASSVITPKHFTHAVFFDANSCFCHACIGTIISLGFLIHIRLCWGSLKRILRRSSFSRFVSFISFRR